jgi:branched-chain amino acid transport system substrate-binding protein
MGALPFMGGDGISDAEFLSSAGSAANGAYYTVAAPEASKLPSAKAFVAEYQKKYGTAVGPYSANAYTIVAIEIAAIEKAITADKNAMPTRAEVLANVAATKNFASPIGVVGFDADGDTTNPILSFYKIVNGKAQFVDQLSLKT